MSVLVVDGFKFGLDPGSEGGGLLLWRCHKAPQCSARFFTDPRHEPVQHPDNSLAHNHLLSRTKMVKGLVFEEIRKFIARRGYAVSDGVVREHALRYLDQAFGTTLNLNELRAVKGAIVRASHFSRTQVRRVSSSSEDDHRRKRRREEHLSWGESDDQKENEIENILDISSDSDDNLELPGMSDLKVENYQLTEPVAKPGEEGQLYQEQPIYLGAGYQGPVPQRIDEPLGIYQQPTVFVEDVQQRYTAYPIPCDPSLPSAFHSLDQPTLDLQPPLLTSLTPEDDDDKFFKNLIPMFKTLSPKDKSMLKAQFLQLVQWKLKSV